MPPEPTGSGSVELQAALPLLRSALAAISVPPPGLAAFQARLEAEPSRPGQPLSPSLEQYPLASLGLDSLGRMEFCIHLELDHGVPLTPDRLAAMQGLGELIAFLADPPAIPS
jgi:hypothetical protein